MLKVLLYSRPELEISADPRRQKLLGYLASTNRLELICTSDLTDFERLAGFDALVLTSPLPEEALAQAEGLVRWVGRGGGLVCLADSADNWSANEPLNAAFKLGGEGYRTHPTELIVRVPTTSSNHPLTQRLSAGYAHDHYAGLDRDTAFTLNDSFYLNRSTHKRDVLLLASWHSERWPVAWLQEYNRGHLFYTGLGMQASSWASPVFEQLVFRAICHVAGRLEIQKPVRVAMLGYGAIGFEHGTAISQVPGLEFAAVCDRNPARLVEAQQAFEGVKTCENVRQVVDDPAIDLVIISTPPNLHAPMALQLLEAGKHVVVEKPFCLTTREADLMIEQADRAGRLLTVYQCRRWDADYLAIQSAVESGLIGEVFHLETFIGGFSHPCDYWHSHEPISGGVFYDWGSHYLDWILGLMPGRVASVSGLAHKRVWLDVTNEDQAKVLIRFEDGREAEFIHSDIAAALKPKWYVLGTQGAIVAQWRNESVKSRRWSGDLIEERLAPSEALPNLNAYVRQENGLIHEQQLSLPSAPVFPFHRNLANHLLLGEPLAVTPRQARRNIAVMEAAKASANQQGQFITIEDEATHFE